MSSQFQKFKQAIEAEYPGCVLEDDGCVLHLTAPQGHTWDGDLHEFVAQHRSGLEYPKDAKWLADAIADLKGRVEAPRVCGHEYCEWCNPPSEEETSLDVSAADTHTAVPYCMDAGFLCATGANGIRFPMYEMKRVVGEAREDQPTQEFIARACNVHDELLAFAQQVGRLTEYNVNDNDAVSASDSEDAMESLNNLIATARKVAAKAEGRSP